MPVSSISRVAGRSPPSSRVGVCARVYLKRVAGKRFAGDEGLAAGRPSDAGA